MLGDTRACEHKSCRVGPSSRLHEEGDNSKAGRRRRIRPWLGDTLEHDQSTTARCGWTHTIGTSLRNECTVSETLSSSLSPMHVRSILCWDTTKTRGGDQLRAQVIQSISIRSGTRGDVDICFVSRRSRTSKVFRLSSMTFGSNRLKKFFAGS